MQGIPVTSFGNRDQVINAAATLADEQGYLTMIDSAWPLKPEPKFDITLIYAGGDTPHPWHPDEIASMPSRWLWPCWVRSDPQDVYAAAEAAAFIAWLHAHGAPPGTCVVLDLETAVNLPYVNAFNLLMRAAGFRVTKYGSSSTIWSNPKTDGGTFVADPTQVPHMVSEGDTEATQYAFDGTFDLSLVKKSVRLWELHVPPLPPHGIIVYQAPAKDAPSLIALAALHHVRPDEIIFQTAMHRKGNFGPLERRYLDAGRLDLPLVAGSWWFIPRS